LDGSFFYREKKADEAMVRLALSDLQAKAADVTELLGRAADDAPVGDINAKRRYRTSQQHAESAWRAVRYATDTLSMD